MAEHQMLIDGMLETMRSGRGTDLGDPQTGVSERIIVFEFAGAVVLRVRRTFRQRWRYASRCYPRRGTPSLDLSNRRSISSRSSSAVGEISAKLPKIHRLISELSL